MSAQTFKKLLDTRVRDGRLEGLVEYEDGAKEWKEPAGVEVSVVNDRTGEAAEVTDVKLGGVPCE